MSSKIGAEILSTPHQPAQLPSVGLAFPRPVTPGRRSFAALLDWTGVWILEAAVVLGIGFWALAIRFPDHQLIPLITDEIEEIAQGFVIARGRGALLVDASTPYNGALWNWLVAATFRLTNYNLFAPRTLMVIIGALTVVAAYPLGRAWGGRAGGILAAALMATAGVHVIDSHVAWSNCATPLFTTLGVWSVWAAVGSGRVGERESGRVGTGDPGH